MDLQAIGIVLASQSKSKGADCADEDQFYKDLAASQRVAKLVELASMGLTLLHTVLPKIQLKRLLKQWKSTSQ